MFINFDHVTTVETVGFGSTEEDCGVQYTFTFVNGLSTSIVFRSESEAKKHVDRELEKRGIFF